MGWYDYKPQTNGVEVAKVIKENGNAFTALGKAFDDIGTGIIEKQKADEESELNKLKKNSMEFAFNQAKEKEAQAKADKDYLTQVYKRPNKKSFEANFDGSIKPSLAAQKEARGYWDDQNKKLELAGAWVDAESDKDYMKAWGDYQVKNPKGNYASFANANPDLVANASVKAISDVKNAWDKKQHDDQLFGLNVKKANASIANSGANTKLHEYQLESAKNKDIQKVKSLEYQSEMLQQSDPARWHADQMKSGNIEAIRYQNSLKNDKDNKDNYNRNRYKSKDIVSALNTEYDQKIDSLRGGDEQTALIQEKLEVYKIAMGLKNKYPNLDGTEIALKAQEILRANKTNKIAPKTEVPTTEVPTTKIPTTQEKKTSFWGNLFGGKSDKTSNHEDEIRADERAKVLEEQRQQKKLQSKITLMENEAIKDEKVKKKTYAPMRKNPRTGEVVEDFLNVF